MIEIEKQVENYLNYCKDRKKLNSKTIKAYRIDLHQYVNFIRPEKTLDPISRECIDSYLSHLHQEYSAKSIKRKIGSLKAFVNHLIYLDVLTGNKE